MKKRTLTLSYPHRTATKGNYIENQYRVEKITNSLQYNPGDQIPPHEAERLCKGIGFDVTIVPAKD